MTQGDIHPRTTGKTRFWVALSSSAIPIVVPGIVSVVHDEGDFVWLGAAGFCVVALIVSLLLLAFRIRGKIAQGIWVGTGIGIVAAVASWFFIIW